MGRVWEIVGGLAIIFGVQLAILLCWTLLDPMTSTLMARNDIDFQVTHTVICNELYSLHGYAM
jgi:hypothetical protein